MLPFGRDRAIRFDNSVTVSEKLTAAGAAQIEYRAAKAHPRFHVSFSEVRSKSLRLVAAASSPMHFSASDAPTGIILIPLIGHTITRSERRRIEWSQQHQAVYLPPGGCEGESNTRVIVGIDVDPARLREVTRVMAGPAGENRAAIDFNTPRALELKRGDVHLGQIIQQQIAMLNALGSDAVAMEKIGLADMILRSAVMLLSPAPHADAKEYPASFQNKSVNLACEYIDANLTEKITLTELEKLSGLSARSLQYAFRSATGRTPMQWITDRRLEAVHAQINAARPGTTLSAIAAAYFSNMGDFAKRYREKYGERPSDALARAHSKPLRT